MLTRSGDVAAAITRIFQAGPDVVRDPHALFREIREAGAVLRAPATGPFPCVHITRFKDVSAALRDPRLSSERPLGGNEAEQEQTSSENALALKLYHQVTELSMLTQDPPNHTRLRRLVAKAFTPRIVAQQAAMVQTILDDLLAQAETESSTDIMRSVAAPLPALVIAAMMGVPQEDWQTFKAWSDGVISFDPTTLPERARKTAKLNTYFRQLIAQRRASPGDDLISALVAAHDADDALTEDEIAAQCQVILVAGHETTTFALGSTLVLLSKQPELWQAM